MAGVASRNEVVRLRHLTIADRNAVKKFLFISAHVILLASIAYQLWRFAELIFVPTSGQNKKEPPATVIVSELRSRPNIESLVSVHLFGEEAAPAPVKSRPTLEAAAPSTKAYRIASLAYSDLQSEASVVLEVRPGDMEFHKPGGMIESGVVLETVFPRGIVIDVGGRPERIEYVGVRQPVLIKVKAGDRAKGNDESEEADWSWLDRWDSLDAKDVVNKLGLRREGEHYVIAAESPLLVNWNLAAGDRLLSINGKPLMASDSHKSVFSPFRGVAVVHILVENSRRRNHVRWERQM